MNILPEPPGRRARRAWNAAPRRAAQISELERDIKSVTRTLEILRGDANAALDKGNTALWDQKMRAVKHCEARIAKSTVQLRELQS